MKFSILLVATIAIQGAYSLQPSAVSSRRQALQSVFTGAAAGLTCAGTAANALDMDAFMNSEV